MFVEVEESDSGEESMDTWSDSEEDEEMLVLPALSTICPNMEQVHFPYST